MPKFSLERTISIKAPAASVFSNVKDFRNWVAWSPWILAEPMCRLEYAEDGRSYSWSGDIIGAGKMEVLDVVENKEIHYRLSFLKPFKSVSSVSFYFDEGSGETNTRWTMSGSLPFFLFWMKRTMVAAISMDYDRGLRMLKDQVELGQVPSTLKFAGFETVEGFEYVGLSRDCKLSEISDRMGADMQQAASILSALGIEMEGPPVCFYERFDMSEGTTRYRIALPVAAGTPCPEGLEKGTLGEIKAYAIHHTGAYRHLGNAWAAGMMHQRSKVFAGSKESPPFEVYRNDPCAVGEEELLSTVYFPAK
ncbi:SRPBCC family protein [Pelagicoccus sp. SDUM812005]|uniref:SRPBCC family protein n=1 Tax=Pelagicoccus sp. SDUM812005 TaxID=3041257 RepID=UPI00280E0DDF|nr:SRPBCC family protein [Pelagicoccus sp. SDUM812005]MDQ8179251.1 SRPBCC family protein [Pelagicoccus sp. SDUM812005]